MTKTIRIGSGAGYAGDRLEPSLELIEKGNLDYISYECLAERTIAIGQQAKLRTSPTYSTTFSTTSNPLWKPMPRNTSTASCKKVASDASAA